MIGIQLKQFSKSYKRGTLRGNHQVLGAVSRLQFRYKKTHPELIDPGDILHALYFSCVRPEARKVTRGKGCYHGSATG